MGLNFLHFRLIFVFTLVLLCPLLANGRRKCSVDFGIEAEKINVKQHCQKEVFGAQFGWNYDNKSRRLDIAFGAKLDGPTGWLAWGLNPIGPHMVGTRALVGIKYENGSSGCLKYNITVGTKLGCPLLPVDHLGLDVPNCTFTHMERIGYYVIAATIYLPPEYNSSRTNIVWQIGDETVDKQPKMHPTTIHNFDSAEIIDLNSDQVKSLSSNRRAYLRTVHGISNIVGWGTFLPAGVIIARYHQTFNLRRSSRFALHSCCQTIGYFIGSAGWAIGLWLGRKSKYYVYTTHGTFAIVIFTVTTIQMFTFLFKPARKDTFRQYWNMYHHFVGYAVLIIICINIFKGIAILRPVNAWRKAYLGVLVTLVAITLLLEVYAWIMFYVKKNQKPKEKQTNKSDSTVSKQTETKT